MISRTLTLLATGFLASIALAAGPLRAVTQQDVEAALAPLPGIKFTQPPCNSKRSGSEKRAKDRFLPTENWTTLKANTGSRSGHMSVVNTLGNVQRRHGGHGYENITAANAYGTQYFVEVSFNKQKLNLVLDTGSSDTWALSSQSNCTGHYSSCLLGPSFAGGFNEEAAVSEHLYIEYGDGEIVQGPMGSMTVSIAGLHVENQTVALANDTYWFGNNVTSGVLGLAFPSLTSAYYGRFGEHEAYLRGQYSPVFSNMVAQGLVENYFSVAIARPGSESEGRLAFGGVPDVTGVDYSALPGITDLIIANLVSEDDTASDYSFYTIIPDGWIYGSSADDRKMPYIVDTGTTFAYLPQALADSINAAFQPPAEYDFLLGGYVTRCDAAPPRVAVSIGGVELWLNPKDLILHDSVKQVSGMCLTTISNGGSGPFILGDVFLQNVLAVFDVDSALLQFATRENYD